MADKEAAADAELPGICPADPTLVDEVAVARAVAGEPVELTVAEWNAAKRAVADRRGIELRGISELLGHVTVVDALGNPLVAFTLAAEVRRHPRRSFARSAWARDKRRATRPPLHTFAATEAALWRNAAPPRGFASGPGWLPTR